MRPCIIIIIIIIMLFNAKVAFSWGKNTLKVYVYTRVPKSAYTLC